MSKILLLGASGFLGRHTLPVLEQKYGKENIVAVCSKDYDLLNFNECQRMFKEIKPEFVVHFAAYSGGIGANKAYPADFYHINILLQSHVFKCAADYGVKKMVYPIGGCSYPSDAKSPIDEGQMWRGYPQQESAGYSAAKMLGIVASKSYRSQYGLKTSVIVPGNMYGEYDNFIYADSHVLPAMLRRYYEAKINNLPEVLMWGSGKPQRDFVYAGDVAKAIPYFIDEYDSDEIVNISSGTTTSIKELAEMIKKFTAYSGEIRWDTQKPDGQMIKIFDTTKMKSLGLTCPTTLLEGIEKTALWLEKNYKDKSDGIRL